MRRVGGVAALYYDLPRATNDLDYIEVVPRDAVEVLQQRAGPDSRLAKEQRSFPRHFGVCIPTTRYAVPTSNDSSMKR